MEMTRAPQTAAGVPAQAPAPQTWESLDRRQEAELALPGAIIGLLGGVIAGGMAAIGGLSPALALISVLALGLPLAAVGAVYDVLLAKGKVPLGPLAPAAMVWAVGFPVSRILHALLLSLLDEGSTVVPNGWVDFIVYNILLSVPFAIGFWWLHENFAPRWWMHLEERNPVARAFMAVLLSSVRERRAARGGRVTGLAGMQERRLRRRGRVRD
jgi:hypothetical protein